jgi:PCI domain
MLHASSINPFDSQEARPYRDDPEIVVMTNLVKAFHNNEIQTFERILRQNQGRVMDDEFIRAYVEDLLRAIRTQVLRRFIRPYERITLSAIATALNDIPMREVENLLVHMILDGSLDGYMDGTSRVLYKRVEYGGGDSSAAGKAASSTNFDKNISSNMVNQSNVRQFAGGNVNKSQTLLQLEAMNEIIGILEDFSRQNTSMQKS